MMLKMKSRLKVLSLLVVLFFSFSQSIFAAAKWQEGTAAIGPNKKQQDCAVGTSATARVKGCSHDVCTAAKQQAAANLRAQYPNCGAYIRGTKTCLNGPGCKK